ncbi:MAG: 3-oxoacyl-ACP synthase [Desulfobulbaceae bacterium]|nr:3-oxoacyl-ACP synthase [Desulfobulbaceae bacterium]
MKNSTIYICGAGIISSLGSGLESTEKKLRENRSALKPLALFALQQGDPLPVGEVALLEPVSSPPRSHQLAEIAASQAMDGSSLCPDAIILGTTTGGILTTEQLLKKENQNKELYRNHGLNTVADYVARETGCSGPAIVVSTACSSGTVAITMAVKMLRSGRVKTVLAGGVDSLARLTYFGFHSLQLVDRDGCKPLDQNRQGMAVAEGAGMLLLSTVKPKIFQGALLGTGLSCDAYHPAAPHPQGDGALAAMENALAEAGLNPEDIDYINLHGTGTPDNDLAESKAVRRLFPTVPPLSSIKGASGHTLAAAGAIEAVVASMAVTNHFMPGNTNLQQLDPELGITPLTTPVEGAVQTVLSNSFGFGGNNGSLIIGSEQHCSGKTTDRATGKGNTFGIHGYACLTGAGDTAETLAGISSGSALDGMASPATIADNLPPRLIRRLKRLPRMSLSLAVAAHGNSGDDRENPHSVFMGTGWGALSETYDFLDRLADTEEKFASPTDFVGSVHNGPASQVAMMFKAKGANITTSGGDYSFEQALFGADLLHADSSKPALILGADEAHTSFSPLFDPSIAKGSSLCDGGGALYVTRETTGAKCCVSLPFYKHGKADNVIEDLLQSLTAGTNERSNYACIMAGIPASMVEQGQKQLEQFLALSGTLVPVVHYRQFVGEFASASAVAAALAVSFLETGTVPAAITEGSEIKIDDANSKILILGLGEYISAMELFAP